MRKFGSDQNVVCPVHGKHARISSQNSSSSGWNFQIDGCCDVLAAAVKKAFGN